MTGTSAGTSHRRSGEKTRQSRAPLPASATKVLIADDLAVNVRLLRAILEAAGFRDVKTTTNAEAVVSIYLGYRPDIVLLDLHMPGLDGLELVKRLRSAAFGDFYLPIVAPPGAPPPDPRRATLDAGASDFVTKPYDATEVVL